MLGDMADYSEDLCIVAKYSGVFVAETDVFSQYHVNSVEFYT